MANKIYNICEKILKITDEEVAEVREVVRQQTEYFSPFKMATTSWQHKLGEHNNNVLNKLLELKEILEQGADIQRKEGK